MFNDCWACTHFLTQHSSVAPCKLDCTSQIGLRLYADFMWCAVLATLHIVLFPISQALVQISNDTILSAHNGSVVLQGLGNLQHYRNKYHGIGCTAHSIAALLNKGFVVAVVRGRHRSVLALPSSQTFVGAFRALERNTIPCLVAIEHFHKICAQNMSSANGWSAPVLHPAYRVLHPHLVDLHRRGRVLSIAKSFSGWLHRLLEHLGELTQAPAVLMHSSLQHEGLEVCGSLVTVVSLEGT